MMADLIRQNAAGGDIVAVTESAGDAEDLVIGGQLWLFEELVDMHHSRFSARLFKSECGFVIAVGAWSSREKDAWFRHGGSAITSNELGSIDMVNGSSTHSCGSPSLSRLRCVGPASELEVSRRLRFFDFMLRRSSLTLK